MSSRLIPIVAALCALAACADEPGDEDGTPGAGGSSDGGGGQHQQGGGGDGGMAGGGDGGMGGSVDEGVDLGGGVTVIPTKLEPGGAAKVIYRGSLSDGEVRLRHGFNGWNSTTGARSSEDDGQGNLDFYIDVPMTPLADGTGLEATLDIPDQARALHMAFSTPDGQSWDNGDGKDYNRGVRFPYLGPYLTWGDTTSPESGVVVRFHTGHECQGSVDFGPTAALGATIAEPSESRSHHIALTDLEPGSAVYYRVACGALVEETVHRFETAPVASSAFTFVALADMQDAGENGRWGDVAEAVMQQHPESAFLVLPGDMAHNDRPGLWWTFFDKGYELFASKAIMPAAGNHDTPGVNSSPDTTSFEQYFSMDAGSGSPTYYQLTYANAHFIALNSERVGEFAVSGGAQYQWTQQAVANAANAAWGFAFWHIPPYNAGNGHWSQQGDVRDMTALFDGAVDWVLCGHEHLYQRTKPLRYNGQLAASYGRGDNDGVGYMVVPPAGVWPRDALIPHDDPKGYYRDRLAYPVVAPPSNTAPSEIGFVAVAVDGPTITLTTYGMGTIASPAALHVVDQHSYTKP